MAGLKHDILQDTSIEKEAEKEKTLNREKFKLMCLLYPLLPHLTFSGPGDHV